MCKALLTDAFGAVLTLHKDVTISGIIAGEYVPGLRGLIASDPGLSKPSSEHRCIGFRLLNEGFRVKGQIRQFMPQPRGCQKTLMEHHGTPWEPKQNPCRTLLEQRDL